MIAKSPHCHSPLPILLVLSLGHRLLSCMRGHDAHLACYVHNTQPPRAAQHVSSPCLWFELEICVELSGDHDSGAGPRPTHEEFMENLGAAAHALKDTLPRVLEFIAGKTISEL